MPNLLNPYRFASGISSPSDISGLVRDWDADAGTFQSDGGAAAVANNDPVGSWVCQVSGVKALQATAANKPLLITNAYNGHACLRFDGSNDQLLAAGGADEQVANPTIVLVAKMTSAGGRVVLGKNHNASGWSSPFCRWILYINATPAVDQRWNGTSTVGGAWSTGDLKVIQYLDNDVYFNGGVVQNNADADLTYPNGLTPIHISGNGVGSEYAHGDYARILIYNRSLTGPELAELNNWLLIRYGLVSSSAPTFRSARTTDFGALDGSSPANILLPADAAVGDKAVFTMNHRRTSASDWTHATATSHGKSTGGVGTGNECTCFIFSKTLDATDVSNGYLQVSATASSSYGAVGLVSLYYDPAGAPVLVEGSALMPNDTNNSSRLTPSYASVTTNKRLVHAGATRFSVSNSTLTLATATTRASLSPSTVNQAAVLGDEAVVGVGSTPQRTVSAGSASGICGGVVVLYV